MYIFLFLLLFSLSFVIPPCCLYSALRPSRSFPLFRPSSAPASAGAAPPSWRSTRAPSRARRPRSTPSCPDLAGPGPPAAVSGELRGAREVDGHNEWVRGGGGRDEQDAGECSSLPPATGRARGTSRAAAYVRVFYSRRATHRDRPETANGQESGWTVRQTATAGAGGAERHVCLRVKLRNKLRGDVKLRARYKYK